MLSRCIPTCAKIEGHVLLIYLRATITVSQIQWHSEKALTILRHIASSIAKSSWKLKVEPRTIIFSSTRHVGPYLWLCPPQGGFRTRIGGSQPINRPVRRIATPKSCKVVLLRRLFVPHPRDSPDPARPAFSSAESLQRFALHCLDLTSVSVQREASAGPGGHAAQMTPAATEFPYLHETS